MARTKQRLINYHGSVKANAQASDLLKGEIAVLHVDTNGTMLGTLDNTANNIVWFISSGAVESAIITLSGDVYTEIQTLTGQTDNIRQELEAVSAYSINNIARIDSGLTAVSGKTATALQSVSATASTGSVTNNYIKAEAGDVTGSDFEKTQQITVTLDVNTNMSQANATGQVADAKVVKDYVDGQTTALQGQIDGINSGLTNLSSTTVNALNGLTIDSGNSIKTYVDSAISRTISSVYRVKGTKETYAALPATGNEVGDVWNVVSAATVDGKPYPAGTNWVWTGSEWDPLGGTVDLSPYATTAVTDALSDRIDGKLNIVNANSAYQTTGSTYLTSTQSKSGTGDAVSGIVTYTINVAQDSNAIQNASATGKVADAKAVKDFGESLFNSATTYASALTATEEERAKNAETALGQRIDAISGSVTSVQFTDLTSGATGVVGGKNANRQESGVAAVIENNTLKLDLDCLVVDCGTF